MAARMRGRVGKITRRGHRAHTTMGLPRGNPMAKGGNFGRGRSGGRRAVVSRSRRRY